MTKIDQIAQAFAQGVKFAENLKLAMDAAKGKDDEDGHWVTVGEGEEARPVFIKGKKKAAKAESKKTESKPAQQRTESKKARQKTSEENIKKAQQLSAYVDQKFKQIARPDIISITETNRGLKMASENIPGASLSTYDAVKGPVSRIRKNISNIDKAMSSAKDQIKAAARDGKIEKDRVDAELTQYRKYCSKFKDYLDYANDQKYDLFRRANDGHRGVIKNLNNLAELTSKLSKNVADWREGLPAQPRAEGNRGTETSRTSRKETALEKRIKDAISKKIPGTDKDTESNIKAALEKIGKHIPLFNESMDKIKEQIAAKEKNGTFDITEANAELTQYRKYCSKFKDYLDSANDQKYDLFRRANDGHRGVIKNLSNLAELTSKLAKSVTDWSEGLPAQPTRAESTPKSFDLSTEEIKDVMSELRGLTDDRTGASEFGRKLFALADLNEEVDKTDKRYSLLLRRSGMTAFQMAQDPLEEAHHHLGLAAKAARSVEKYHWRGAIPSLKSEITRHLNRAKKLQQVAQAVIDDELTKLSEELPLWD